MRNRSINPVETASDYIHSLGEVCNKKRKVNTKTYHAFFENILTIVEIVPWELYKCQDFATYIL